MTVIAEPGSPLLSLSHVRLSHASHDRVVTAVEDFSLNLAAGERIAILGPSGCGKSSLLKAIGGFLPIASGRITVEGRPIGGPDPERMMVFQDTDQLFPWKTVLGNVEFALKVARPELAARVRQAEALDAVARVGLGDFAGAFPHTLSGGMRQRAAIARALAVRPPLLLMDEPFGALDALTRRAMQNDLLLLWRDRPFGLVFVTHSVDEAIRIGQRIIVMSARPGRILTDLPSARNPEARHQLSRRLLQLLGMRDESDDADLAA